MSPDQQSGREYTPEFLREPLGPPMFRSVLFHVAIVGGIVGFTLLRDLFPQNTWGGANDGGAIAVQLVSNALPLPADKKPNDNVLATEKPSEAPAPPAPRHEATVDTKSIPIPTKITPPKKIAEKKQEESKPQKVVPPPVTQAKGSPHNQPVPKPDNHAQFGEQSSSRMQRAVNATTSSNGQVSVTQGSRGFNYPYYVEGISRKFTQNSYRNEVDPRTPAGSRSYIIFTIRRDGTPSDVKLDRSSGSPTLDRACIRAAQRVDTYGPLPSPPGDGNLSVSYYCDY